jgi:hypothetical protein
MLLHSSSSMCSISLALKYLLKQSGETNEIINISPVGAHSAGTTNLC